MSRSGKQYTILLKYVQGGKLGVKIAATLAKQVPLPAALAGKQ